MAEMTYFVNFFGGHPDSVLGLAGAGDLYVTCQAGRNGRMGSLLGKGLRYKEAKSNHMPNDTVEGAELALAIGKTLKRWLAGKKIDGNSIPLATKIVEAICDNLPLQIPWNLFYQDT
jgi:glycerol-3-phosphate dehydrogenase (NAD(P)+)